MKLNLLLLLVVLTGLFAFSFDAPAKDTFLTCDVTSQPIVSIGILLDELPKFYIPATSTNLGGKFCNYNASNLPPGDHSIRMTFFNWTDKESVPSNQINFTILPTPPTPPISVRVRQQ